MQPDSQARVSTVKTASLHYPLMAICADLRGSLAGPGVRVGAATENISDCERIVRGD